MPDIGAAAFAVPVAFDRYSVHLAIHLRRAIRAQPALAQRLGKLFGRISINGDMHRSAGRQPWGEGLQIHAGRNVPRLGLAIPPCPELLGVILLGIGNREVVTIVGRRHRRMVLLDHHRQAHLNAGIGGQSPALLRFGLLRLLRLIRPLLVLPLKGAHQSRELLRVGGGPENLARVVFQRANPSTDIGHVLPWVVADAELLAEHQRRDLRTQFLPGIRFGPERMGEVGAIESRGVA